MSLTTNVLNCRVSRDQILDALRGTDCVIESYGVDWHVRALRAKPRDDRHQPRYVETAFCAGYRPVAAAVAES